MLLVSLVPLLINVRNAHHPPRARFVTLDTMSILDHVPDVPSDVPAALQALLVEPALPDLSLMFQDFFVSAQVASI